MNNSEAINQRKSRRNYLDTIIDNTKLTQLNGLIDKYNCEVGLSITLILNGSRAFNSLRKSYGMFKNIHTLIALKGEKTDPNLNEKLGYYGELIVLEATKLGLGTCWVGGTFDRQDTAVKIKETEELPCVITIGNIVEEQTFKEKLIYNLTHRKTKCLEEFYSSDSVVPHWFIDGIKAVQKAPSAINRQPVKFEFKNGEVRAFVDESYHFNLVDLGIAKAHFSLATDGSFEFGNHGLYHKQQV